MVVYGLASVETSSPVPARSDLAIDLMIDTPGAITKCRSAIQSIVDDCAISAASVARMDRLPMRVTD